MKGKEMKYNYNYDLINKIVNRYIRLLNYFLLRRKYDIAKYFYDEILCQIYTFYKEKYISYQAYWYFRTRVSQIFITDVTEKGKKK